MEFILAVETYKNKCIGPLIRCSTAFGATIVAIVGSPKYSTHGAHGAQNHMQVIHFYYWKDLIEYVKERGCQTCSISPKSIEQTTSSRLDDDSSVTTISTTKSHSVDDFQFIQSTCFIVGEREELTTEQINICDHILHVEIPNMNYQHLVHYDTKISLCFQQFAIQSNFKISEYNGEKHVLGALEQTKVRLIKYAKQNLKTTAADGGATIEDTNEMEDDYNISNLYD